MSMHDENEKEWPTPETTLVAAMFKQRPVWQNSAVAIAGLYATRPTLCEISKGHYPPRFVWWVERFVRDKLTNWKRGGTDTQRDRRKLVLAALDRVHWDAIAEHFERASAEHRERYPNGMAVRRKAEEPFPPPDGAGVVA
jgi:hypothetical protein